MIDVVFLYKHDPAGWDELRYALRSLSNLQFEIRVNIVADQLPDWLTNVRWVPALNIEGRYRDVSTKIQNVCKSPRFTNQVLFMYDDQYFLKETAIENLQELHYVNDWTVCETYNVNGSTASARWHATMVNTLHELGKRGYQQYSFESHLPRLVTRSDMVEVFQEFPVIEKNLQRWTCWGNWLVKHRKLTPVHLASSGVKAGFYKNQPFDPPVLSGKRFLNHDDAGLNTSLKSFIKMTFNQKSVYER